MSFLYRLNEKQISVCVKMPFTKSLTYPIQCERTKQRQIYCKCQGLFKRNTIPTEVLEEEAAEE